MRPEPRVHLHRPVPVAARGLADHGRGQGRSTRATPTGSIRPRVPTMGSWFRAGGLRHLLQGQVARQRRRPLPARQPQPAAVVQPERRARPVPRGHLPRGRHPRGLRLHRLDRPGAARQQPAELGLVRTGRARSRPGVRPVGRRAAAGAAHVAQAVAARQLLRQPPRHHPVGRPDGRPGQLLPRAAAGRLRRPARPVRPQLPRVGEGRPDHEAGRAGELPGAVPAGVPAAQATPSGTSGSTTSCRRTSTSTSARSCEH